MVHYLNWGCDPRIFEGEELSQKLRMFHKNFSLSVLFVVPGRKDAAAFNKFIDAESMLGVFCYG